MSTYNSNKSTTFITPANGDRFFISTVHRRKRNPVVMKEGRRVFGSKSHADKMGFRFDESCPISKDAIVVYQGVDDQHHPIWILEEE